MQRRVVVMLAVVVLAMVAVIVLPDLGLAQSANPWEKPLQDISTSVTGPVAMAGFLIGLGIFCLMWIMGAHGAIGLAVGVVVGGAILGNAETIASWLGLGA